MTQDQVRFVMERIYKKQTTTIEDVKFPVTVIVRLDTGILLPVTLNCLNFIGDGELHADYDNNILIIARHDEAMNREYIPFDRISSIRAKMYELEDKKLF